jgi:hypothetical protein
VAAGQAAAQRGGVFDCEVEVDPDDQLASLARLAEALHRFYPDSVALSLVWGYGRPLWDPAARVYGRRPLRVVVLGPAGSGKSTQCELMARRCVGFGWRRACAPPGLLEMVGGVSFEPSLASPTNTTNRFDVPHINAGDLLHSEVQRRTPLGVEAQQYMHSSKTVPDR